MTTRILTGDARDVLKTLPDNSIDCVVTSPPYFGLRDYGTAAWEGGHPDCDHRKVSDASWRSAVASSTLCGGKKTVGNAQTGYGERCAKCGAIRIDSQIGLEATPAVYVAEMVAIFREVRRVLKKTGTLWLNLGDSYSTSPKGNPGSRGTINGGKRDGAENDIGSIAMDKSRLPGLKQKDLVGIPWRVAFALQDDGWYLRQDIIWHKLNPMPESVRDRCTKAHEYLFLLSKSARYHYDGAAIAEKSVDPVGSSARYQSAFGAGPKGNAYRAINGTPVGMKEYTGMRNKRSVWSLVSRPFPGAHFATFPPKLVELCLKAGCPDKVCSQCGAPWTRHFRTIRPSSWEARKIAGHIGGIGGSVKLQRQHGSTHDFDNRAGGFGTPKLQETDGVHPSCRCHAPSTGGTVMDPFGGAGTTSLVADRMGLHSIMIELNPEYAEMARWRLIDEAGMFAEVAAE